MVRKNRTEELVRRAYGDPSENDDDNALQKSSQSHRNGDDDEDDDKYERESLAGSVGSRASSASSSKANHQVKSLVAGKEAQKVKRMRWFVLALLVIAGATLSTATYFFLTQQAQADYHTSYATAVSTIEQSSIQHIGTMQQAFQSLSETISATAIAKNMTWPFVTLSKSQPFEVQGRHVREESSVEFFGFHPLVKESVREEWLNYTFENAFWYEQSRLIAASMDETYSNKFYLNGTFAKDFYRMTGPSPHNATLPHAPTWESSPPPFKPEFINYNILGTPWYNTVLPALERVRDRGLFTNVYNLSVLSGLAVRPETHLNLHEQYSDNALTLQSAYDHPHSLIVYPIFEAIGANNTSDVVGILAGVVPWDAYLSELLPDGVEGIVCVLVNNCGQAFTYTLNGRKAFFSGLGDQHDDRFSDSRHVVPLYQQASSENSTNSSGPCDFSIVIYSSQTYSDLTTSNVPVIFAVAVALVFVLVICTFLMYDRFVRRRNEKLVNAAVRSDKILSSLFPSNVRSRLFEAQESTPKATKASSPIGPAFVPAAKSRLRIFLDSGDASDGIQNAASNDDIGYEGKPIADLFPETTVIFADIAGFTAWSSVREPAQVFTLLETLYRAFDEIASKRKVFKVETVGDCYVAVTGLPDPRKDHAVAMARFARDCMNKMNALTKRLEVTLGPDTGDLMLRAGLHSGPVTAGVLRGERSRFQLFGDTMNTASRMESTGSKGRIQCSQDTADLLIAAGKKDWVTARDDTVVAKGKGEMQTYWIDSGVQRPASNSSGDDPQDVAAALEAVNLTEAIATRRRASMDELSAEKTRRLIEWNVDVLLRLLKQIVAKRLAKKTLNVLQPIDESLALKAQLESGKTVIDEVKEIVNLPGYSAKAAASQEDPEFIVLPNEVSEQLYDYVTNIAALYNGNPFHNFEHASHVTMSVTKLLSRIVAPAEIEYDDNAASTGKSLHDHTYGITSDPLTQFACVFSALIHDVDHAGVPNVQLVNEKTFIAEFYKGKSVAEQNSVDLAWQLLMDPAYEDLRRTIYWTEGELKRFRQLVVNSVMATDIVDKDLKTLRNARWTKAFSEDGLKENETEACRVNRKATIVIEHLIQASDVAHTMQHWHIYRKWNELFFLECYKAYTEGRAEKDPIDGWYDGEKGFYDFYIIPLAKKLKDCGVFGVSSDEYLNYAIRNRQEWEERGQAIVHEMAEKARRRYATSLKQVGETQSIQRRGSNQ